jgi:hypothetical protein
MRAERNKDWLLPGLEVKQACMRTGSKNETPSRLRGACLGHIPERLCQDVRPFYFLSPSEISR